MRFAEGPTVEVEAHVDAPPAVVWSIVTDVNMPARFSSEFRGGEWLDGASGPDVGARFLGRNHHPAVGEWQSVSTVVSYEAERLFAWAVGEPQHPAAAWRFELEPDGEGTRLRQWARLGPGRSNLTRIIDAAPEKEEEIVAYRLEWLRVNMAATLGGIRALAEGRDA